MSSVVDAAVNRIVKVGLNTVMNAVTKANIDPSMNADLDANMDVVLNAAAVDTDVDPAVCDD